VGILVQLWFLLQPHMGPEPYRHKERMKAFADWKRLGTPNAKAAWHAEGDRLDQHLRLTSIVVTGGFLLINGVLCYVFWNCGKKEAANKLLQATAR
jgi:hypothetical protein